MSPDRNALGPARPSAAINAEIRRLWESTGGRLTWEQRRQYEQLVTEWAAAQRLESACAGGYDEKAPPSLEEGGAVAGRRHAICGSTTNSVG